MSGQAARLETALAPVQKGLQMTTSRTGLFKKYPFMSAKFRMNIPFQPGDREIGNRDKTEKWVKWYVFSVCWILILTGLAKIASSFGHVQVLEQPDPIFNFPFRTLMLLVGLLELLVSAICLFGKSASIRFKLGLVTWLSSNMAFYRWALWYVHWQKPCPCMGTLTSALHVPPHDADFALKIILAYLLLGGIFLIGDNIQKDGAN
jgi:hypothetical protein